MGKTDEKEKLLSGDIYLVADNYIIGNRFHAIIGLGLPPF